MRNDLSINITNTCPRQTIALLRRDVEQTILARGLYKSIAKSDGDDVKPIFDYGAFFKPLRNLYQKLPPRKASCLVAWVTGGTFLRGDLLRFGYNLDPACPRCGEGIDSVFHRCFSCPFIESEVKDRLGTPLFNEIISQGEYGLLATRGIAPNPPLETAAAGENWFEFFGMRPDECFLPSGGDVFVDGSCFNPSVPELSRAGFGVCQIDPSGLLRKGVWGLVPHPFPQNSLSGEVCAFGVAAQMSRGCNVVSDCSEVVRAWKIGLAKSSVSSAVACSFKQLLLRCPEYHDNIANVIKTKAHRKLEDVGDNFEDMLIFKGNDAADVIAKKGAGFHQSPESDVTLHRSAKRKLLAVANHVIDTLCSDEFSSSERYTLLPRGTKLHTQSGDRHSFTWQGKCWICTRCFLRISQMSCQNFRFNSKCGGLTHFDKLLATDNGHQFSVALSSDQSPILFCSRCWAFCEVFPRKLRDACPGIVGPFGKTVKRRILNGVHPSDPSCAISKPVRVRSILS